MGTFRLDPSLFRPKKKKKVTPARKKTVPWDFGARGGSPFGVKPKLGPPAPKKSPRPVSISTGGGFPGSNVPDRRAQRDALIKAEAAAAAKAAALKKPGAANPVSGGRAQYSGSSAPPVGSGSSTGGGGGGTTSGSTASVQKATAPMMDPATKLLLDKRKGVEMMHAQNLKDMESFQTWLGQQQDTAEGFLKQRFDDSQAQYQRSLESALQTAKNLNTENQGLAQGFVNPEMQNAAATGAIINEGIGSREAESQNARNAAASLMANERLVNTARVKDFRNLELNRNNQRLNELDKLDLENMYKQQQFQIDSATAEALGAKNAGELALANRRMALDESKYLTTAQQNAERLRIDQAYKAGMLSAREREVALKELGPNKNIQKDARVIAQKVRAAWSANNNKKPFTAKVPKDIQARVMQSVILAIRNDYPDITPQQMVNVINAEFGVGMLKDPEIRNRLKAAGIF